MRNFLPSMRAAGRYAGEWVRRAVGVAVLVAASTVVLAGVSSAQTATAPTGSSAVSAAAAAPSTTAAKAGDNASTRTVNRIIAVLVTFGAVLLALAVWFWWATRPVPRHLDALDAMSSRSWREADAKERAAMLAPVHERRGEVREEDLIVAPELVEETVPAFVVGESDEAVAASAGGVGDERVPAEPPPAEPLPIEPLPIESAPAEPVAVERSEIDAEEVPATASLAAPRSDSAPEDAPSEPAPRP